MTMNRIYPGMLEDLVEIIAKAIEGATTLAEIRLKIAEGAKRGDLDNVIERFKKANDTAEDFIRNG